MAVVGDDLLGDLEARTQAQEFEVSGGCRAGPMAMIICQQDPPDEQHDRQDDDLADDGQHSHVPIERDGCALAAPCARAAGLVSHRNRLLGGAIARRTPGRRSAAAPGCGSSALLAEGRRVHQATVRSTARWAHARGEVQRRVRTEGAIEDLAVVAHGGDDVDDEVVLQAQRGTEVTGLAQETLRPPGWR